MREQSLTDGPVSKTMLLFAVPLILGNLLQQAYNIVDTWVVGHFVGSEAVAAVGSAFTLMNFLTSILLGLSLGSGVVISYYFAKNESTRLHSCVQASFFLVAAAAFILTVSSVRGIGLIIRWLNIPDEIIPLIHSYLSLVFWGIPAIFLYNFFAAYLKAIGNAKIPLVFLGIAAGINIVLDVVFVVWCNLGCAGVGLATVVAQYVSGIGISCFALVKLKLLREALLTLRWKLSALREVISYAFFTCLQQSVMNLGILSIQGLVNSFGTTVMAAFAAAAKIDAFAFMPAIEYSNAFSTFVAQNKGAQKPERIQTGIRLAALTCICYGVCVSLITCVLAKPFMLFFIDGAEGAVIAAGVQYLHIEGACYMAFSILYLCYGLYRASAKPQMSFVLTVVSLGTRVLISYTFATRLAAGVLVIWYAIPIGWVLADLVGLVYFLKSRNDIFMA